MKVKKLALKAPLVSMRVIIVKSSLAPLVDNELEGTLNPVYFIFESLFDYLEGSCL